MGTSRHLYWILTSSSFAVQGVIKNFAYSKFLVVKLISFINFPKGKKGPVIFNYSSSKVRQQRQRRQILHTDVSKVHGYSSEKVNKHLRRWRSRVQLTDPWMKEVRDNTWRVGGLPMLPGLYLSTFQPSQRGFFCVHLGV
jgi:hypothetical protein